MVSKVRCHAITHHRPEPEVNGVVVRPVPQLAVREQPLALVPVGSVHRKPLDVDAELETSNFTHSTGPKIHNWLT